MSDIDGLAEFLLARSRDPLVGDADRLRCTGMVDSYRTGMARAEVELAMRHMARRFADHRDYRYEWRPELQPPLPAWNPDPTRKPTDAPHDETPHGEAPDGLWGHPRRDKRPTRHNPGAISQQPLT